MSCTFERYVGIDYSGAETANSSLSALRVYEASPGIEATEIRTTGGQKIHWTRRRIAEWLVERLSEAQPTLAGIDHGFSFPMKYFQKYGLAHDWSAFLADFQKHWPTDADNTYVDFVREGECGNAQARCGDSRWRRLTEMRARAKSVFHFDVPGSVAKSTHAGIPWLLYLRNHAPDRVHFWPFDGWQVPKGKSAVVEIYPALWCHSFPSDGRNRDQQDAYAAAEWLRRSDIEGSLHRFFSPTLTENDRKVAGIEGWILGIT
ncbi:MAG TPA: hypothetical protein VJN89_01990 [Candidatus Acidoferrum sp.]|nr:hypothetical protein [Candidatus Acidoferrum sp.]